MAVLRDIDIRSELDQQIRRIHASDPSTVIVHELGILQGTTRADIAVVNGSLAAFEIKSERDTLARLPSQLAAYQRVFDYVTLVVSEKHAERVLRCVPDWCGVTVAVAAARPSVRLETLRAAEANEDVEARAVVELLWREEALEFLAEHGADHGIRSKSRRYIWDRVCEVFTLPQVKERVRYCLKRREALASSRWRP